MHDQLSEFKDEYTQCWEMETPSYGLATEIYEVARERGYRSQWHRDEWQDMKPYVCVVWDISERDMDAIVSEARRRLAAEDDWTTRCGAAVVDGGVEL